MDGRPSVAIIDTNTLAVIGLKQILQNIMPILTIDTFGSFAELQANDPEYYVHYFVSMNLLLENRSFFKSVPLSMYQCTRERTRPVSADAGTTRSC